VPYLGTVNSDERPQVNAADYEECLACQ